MNHEKLNKAKKVTKSWKDAKTKSDERRAVNKAKRQKRNGKRIFIDGVAKKLRKNIPKSELWFHVILKEHSLFNMFKQNVTIFGLIPDLHNREYKIVIEVDGSIHALERVKKRDEKNEKRYNHQGFKVFRINHNDNERALELIQQLKELFKYGPKEHVLNIEYPPINEQLKNIERILLAAPKTKLRKKAYSLDR